MLNYIKQNKQVIMVAVTLFVVSMSTVLFFFGSNGNQSDLKADVVDHGTVTESADVKSLKEEEKSYRELVNNQEDPVFVMNMDGTIKFSSGDVENTLDYKQDDLKNQLFFLLMNPEDLSTFLGAFSKVTQDKTQAVMVGPYRLRDKNGEYHLHMGSLTPIISHGVVEGIAVSSKDISKKVDKDAEDRKMKPAKSSKPKGKKIQSEKETDHGRFLAENNSKKDAQGVSEYSF